MLLTLEGDEIPEVYACPICDCQVWTVLTTGYMQCIACGTECLVYDGEVDEDMGTEE